VAVFLLICFWLALCVLVGLWAQRRGRDGAVAFTFAVLFSPLVMWLVHLAIGPKDDAASSATASDTTPEPRRRCPECAEWVLAAAQKCKHCGERLDPVPPPTPMRQQFDNPLRIDEIDR